MIRISVRCLHSCAYSRASLHTSPLSHSSSPPPQPPYAARTGCPPLLLDHSYLYPIIGYIWVDIYVLLSALTPPFFFLFFSLSHPPRSIPFVPFLASSHLPISLLELTLLHLSSFFPHRIHRIPTSFLTVAASFSLSCPPQYHFIIDQLLHHGNLQATHTLSTPYRNPL